VPGLRRDVEHYRAISLRRKPAPADRLGG